MARLNNQLRYFINQKLTTDPAWQKVEIILSGHEVRDSWFCIDVGVSFFRFLVKGNIRLWTISDIVNLNLIMTQTLGIVFMDWMLI